MKFSKILYSLTICLFWHHSQCQVANYYSNNSGEMLCIKGDSISFRLNGGGGVIRSFCEIGLHSKRFGKVVLKERADLDSLSAEVYVKNVKGPTVIEVIREDLWAQGGIIRIYKDSMWENSQPIAGGYLNALAQYQVPDSVMGKFAGRKVLVEYESFGFSVKQVLLLDRDMRIQMVLRLALSGRWSEKRKKVKISVKELEGGFVFVSWPGKNVKTILRQDSLLSGGCKSTLLTLGN